MARIAAFLPDRTDRESLQRCMISHELVWAESWRDLHRIVRSQPVSAAIADAHAEVRKDGVLRVFRFSERFPLTPLVVWGDYNGRDLYRLGKAGCTQLVLTQDMGDSELVREVVSAAAAQGCPNELLRPLSEWLDAESMKMVAYALTHVPSHIQVPALAQAFDLSISTLERRLERHGLPTPGRMLLWLRVLYGLYWLLEPGRSVESVAGQLGYSSGAAFRRAIRATVGARPTPLRTRNGLSHAVTLFLAECSRSAPRGEVQ